MKRRCFLSEQIVYAEVFRPRASRYPYRRRILRQDIFRAGQRLSSCDFLRCHRSYLVHRPMSPDCAGTGSPCPGRRSSSHRKQNYLLIQRALAAYRLRAGRPILTGNTIWKRSYIIMNISKSTENGQTVLKLNGRLDTTTAPVPGYPAR